MDIHIKNQLEIEGTKYPVECCLPILFGEKPKYGSSVNSGTISLYQSTNKVIGITCDHIIEEYLSKYVNGSILQIGNYSLQLDKHLIDRNKSLDLATLAFTQNEYNKMRQGKVGSIVPSIICNTQLSYTDRIAFGGFTGEWRTRSGLSTLTFDSFSIGACDITTIEDDQFSCRVDKLSDWPQLYNYYKRPLPQRLGGLSGAPVLLIKEISNIIYWELAGIIYQGDFIIGTESFKIYARYAKYIQPDGSIRFS